MIVLVYSYVTQAYSLVFTTRTTAVQRAINENMMTAQCCQIHWP